MEDAEEKSMFCFSVPTRCLMKSKKADRGGLIYFRENHHLKNEGRTYIGLFFKKFRRDRNLQISKTVGGTLIAFRYNDLQHVTSNFSEKLGGGAFGSVFKGKLPDSTAIVVKRLDGFHQGEKQFRAEVRTIGTTQHVNLVRLLGFCSEGSRRLLVYEYMQKGSLEVQLLPGETTTLSWATRYQIALETARGLNYLHEKCQDGDNLLNSAETMNKRS